LKGERRCVQQQRGLGLIFGRLAGSMGELQEGWNRRLVVVFLYLCGQLLIWNVVSNDRSQKPNLASPLCFANCFQDCRIAER
jgi:hypothetical protein